MTVDAVVEGVHFRRASSRARGRRHKALGGQPLRPRGDGSAAALGAGGARGPARIPARRCAEARCGLGALARGSGTALVGGNVTRAPGLALSVTVGGEASPGRALRRSGARPGNRVWVSGTLGDARLGFGLLQRPGGPEARRLRGAPRLARTAIDRQRRPVPRLALGAALVGVASACIDLSDGLAQDAGHVAAASGVALHLDAGLLPVSRALAAAHPDGRARARVAASGGEDYELLFTAPASRELALGA